VSNQPNGRRAVQFIAGDGRRRSIRLGKVSREAAESVKLRVEQLLTCRITGHAMSRDLALWVRDLDDVLHGKLAAVGLVERRNTFSLGEAIDAFKTSRAGCKATTRTQYGRTFNHLLRYFGESFDLRKLTPREADAWWADMHKRGLAVSTIGRTVRTARSLLEQARRDGLDMPNPFAHLSGSSPSNPKRLMFIERDVVQRVIDVCPNSEWRLIIALARYGGLRVPSELNRLRWADVLWDRDRFIVHASKTEHHADGGIRQVPIFPELLPYLRESFELADPGAEYVIVGQRTTTNLRTHFTRLIKRAGLTPWPKLFQNLRASRETELMQTYPVHAATRWIGNSPKVALDHYAIVREDDYRAAAEPSGEALQKAVQNAVQSGGVSCYTALDAADGKIHKSLEKQGESSDMQLLEASTRKPSIGPGRIRTSDLTVISGAL